MNHLLEKRGVTPRLPAQSYVKIALEAPRRHFLDQRALKNFLISQGIPPDQIVFSKFRSKYEISTFTRSLKKASKVNGVFPSWNPGYVTLKIKSLRREDWRDQWKSGYRPLSIGRRFKIIPVWLKDKTSAGGKIPIYLDPGAAFGSGKHETTQIMIQLMEEVKGRFKNFLDLGTGTGILLIAASYLGAQKNLGIDLDAASIRAARANLLFNHCPCCQLKKIRVEALKQPDSFDLVGANLGFKLLVGLRGQIISFLKTGSFLIVSGILRKDERNFQKEFGHRNLKLIKILKSRSWAGLLYQKRAS